MNKSIPQTTQNDKQVSNSIKSFFTRFHVSSALRASKGWIRIYSEETDSRKKKQYIITDLGADIFREEKRRLDELLANAALFEEEQENG